jgi:hypothetical protein
MSAMRNGPARERRALIGRSAAAILALALLFPGAFAAVAQERFAPGPSLPPFHPGGYGPGGFLLAPGPSAAGVDVELVGPGGTRLARGAAGRLSNSRIVANPRTPCDRVAAPRRSRAKRALHR